MDFLYRVVISLKREVKRKRKLAESPYAKDNHFNFIRERTSLYISPYLPKEEPKSVKNKYANRIWFKFIHKMRHHMFPQLYWKKK